MMKTTFLPVGKLPPNLLKEVLSMLPSDDPSVLLGPGIGLDCAVLQPSGKLIALKTDPITFAAEEIGWYGVQIASNDIVTTGATPRWMLVTLLLPEGKTTPDSIRIIGTQLSRACQEKGIVVIGGHTEITAGLDRPIFIATMLGEVESDRWLSPKGSCTGDAIMITKTIPIEFVSIVARELKQDISSPLSILEMAEAQSYLYNPGISVFTDAITARNAGRVTAMHDPTEGGVASALYEMAEASQHTFMINSAAIPVSPLARKICRHYDVNPLAAISSGALLMTVHPEDVDAIVSALAEKNIACTQIGVVTEGPAEVREQETGEPIVRPDRDEIARLFES